MCSWHWFHTIQRSQTVIIQIDNNTQKEAAAHCIHEDDENEDDWRENVRASISPTPVHNIRRIKCSIPYIIIRYTQNVWIFGREKKRNFINLIRQPNNSKSMLLGMISMSHSGKMFNLYTIADGCYGRWQWLQ